MKYLARATTTILLVLSIIKLSRGLPAINEILQMLAWLILAEIYDLKDRVLKR